jgi:hypothetical protein
VSGREREKKREKEAVKGTKRLIIGENERENERN